MVYEIKYPGRVFFPRYALSGEKWSFISLSGEKWSFICTSHFGSLLVNRWIIYACISGISILASKLLADPPLGGGVHGAPPLISENHDLNLRFCKESVIKNIKSINM